MSGRYDDTINLPHHQSTKHPHMSMTDRSAQFSPFAALTGYGAVITETGRLTEERIELTEEQKDEIDRKLNELIELGKPALITFFEPDEWKAGGHYVSASGRLKKVDPLEGILVLDGGDRIPIRDILSVEEEDKETE